MTKLLTRQLVRRWLPARRRSAHKGDFGHVLILAGSRGMTGAAVLSAAGALRSGAGLVTVGVPETELGIVARRVRPEAMVLGLPATRAGALSASGLKPVNDFLRRRRITVMAAGPGLSVNRETRSLLRRLLFSSSLPLVLDADALNNLAGRLPRQRRPVVITPHPGEMGRLAGLSAGQVQKDREKVAASFARRFNLICVLKGHRTVVTDGWTTYLNTTGNPGMATGGSGDVLTGILAGCLAQRPRPLEAAAAAVFLHGLAGDIAARARGERGLLAMDITEAFPAALRRTQH